MTKLAAAQQQDQLNFEAARVGSTKSFQPSKINGGYHASSPPTRTTRDYNQANDFAATILLEASYVSIAQRHSCRSQGNNPNSQNMIFLERDEQGQQGHHQDLRCLSKEQQPDTREPNWVPTHCHKLGLKIYI